DEPGGAEAVVQGSEGDTGWEPHGANRVRACLRSDDLLEPEPLERRVEHSTAGGIALAAAAAPLGESPVQRDVERRQRRDRRRERRHGSRVRLEICAKVECDRGRLDAVDAPAAGGGDENEGCAGEAVQALVRGAGEEVDAAVERDLLD